MAHLSHGHTTKERLAEIHEALVGELGIGGFISVAQMQRVLIRLTPTVTRKGLYNHMETMELMGLLEYEREKGVTLLEAPDESLDGPEAIAAM